MTKDIPSREWGIVLMLLKEHPQSLNQFRDDVVDMLDMSNPSLNEDSPEWESSFWQEAIALYNVMDEQRRGGTYPPFSPNPENEIIPSCSEQVAYAADPVVHHLQFGRRLPRAQRLAMERAGYNIADAVADVDRWIRSCTPNQQKSLADHWMGLAYYLKEDLDRDPSDLLTLIDTYTRVLGYQALAARIHAVLGMPAPEYEGWWKEMEVKILDLYDKAYPPPTDAEVEEVAWLWEEEEEDDDEE